MTRLSAHFDGRVIVPDEPIDLPADTRLIVQIESAIPDIDSLGSDGDEFIASARAISFDATSLAEIEKGIQEGCERVDADGW